MCALAGFLPLNRLAELTNIGTLGAFVVVCAGVLVIRRTHPHLKRGFRTPGGPVIPVLGMVFCATLMTFLSAHTWFYFCVVLVVAVLVYFLYSRNHSMLAAATS
jgi:basic amino acid/polyamine antiporter, APA family